MENELKNRILNNIVREVEAIRGYLIDPVDGDFIHDEIKHIEELAAALKTACGIPAADDEDDDEPDGDGDDVDETNYNPYTGQDDAPETIDPEEGEHY